MSETQPPINLGPWKAPWRNQPVPLVSRFWTNVEKVASGCWVWLGREQDRQGRSGGGYGIISAKAPSGRWRKLLAHRVSFLIHNGYLPPAPLQVLHRCDVRLCVNPEHLFLGTRSDNMLDAARKGRLNLAKLHAAGQAALSAKRART